MPLSNHDTMTYTGTLRQLGWRALIDEAFRQGDLFSRLAFKETDRACEALERQKLAVAEQDRRLGLADTEAAKGDYRTYSETLQSGKMPA
ncbi:hypothetical protein [Sagittula sp. MA-2]|jgi:hypothetical protein|uniref:hypothetical protein n=1 Tax=Sagittula sp. MA-2 TaxID=3048007 RepID=UPI0024C3284E|nr:hypothetical protein [Sagittula sp. MA-2]WHZ36527.1 hypothetical protein QNI11_05815 [Sagittula sp. MA-2]